MDQEKIVRLPKLGESILGATIVRWLKEEGDSLSLDEPLVEVATDKVNSEIPSPHAGILAKQMASIGQELSVGEPLALLTSEGSSLSSEKSQGEISTHKKKGEDIDRSSFLTPAVRRIAKEKGLDIEWVRSLKGTGAGSRISLHDLKRAEEKEGHLSEERKIPLSPLRQSIARQMLLAKTTIPDATLFYPLDITNILDKIEREGSKTEQGSKLSLTVYLALATAQAAQRHPLIHATLAEDHLITRPHPHLGIAVSVDQGVVVPVIRKADTLSLRDMAKHLNSLAEKGRARRLTNEEMSGGTLTLTNFGMGGATMGIPIIRHPEVAIIGVGAIQHQLLPTEGGGILPRKVVTLSLTFDHRVIDGMEASAYLQTIESTIKRLID
ncbi:MAG: dihydrolipoamide acetyltransferase family protein [Chlamydiota bacterium]|nr:dihydrolipoamide acetyltransferase family protein [Chlamydiota bacterium]